MSVMGGGFNRSPAGPLHVTPAHNPVQRAASPCRREPRFEMLGIGSRHLSEPTARHHTHRQLLKAPQPTQPPPWTRATRSRGAGILAPGFEARGGATVNSCNRASCSAFRHIPFRAFRLPCQRSPSSLSPPTGPSARSSLTPGFLFSALPPAGSAVRNARTRGEVAWGGVRVGQVAVSGSRGQPAEARTLGASGQASWRF